MRRASRSLYVVVLAVLALSLGCSGGSGGSGSGIPLTQLSSGSDYWSDIARTSDGTLHVVYTEWPSGGAAQAVFYRSSSDQGATWQPPVELSAELPDRLGGRAEIAVDGQDRVYAVWKSMAQHEGDGLRGGPYAGALVARVLSGGSWSSTFTVSTNDQVRSFFLATDAQGQVHAVWSENSPESNGSYTLFAGTIQTAALQGTSASAPALIVRMPADDHGGYYYYDSFEGLRGYIDPAGSVRFTATRIPAYAGEEQADVVYCDGTSLASLFPLTSYGYYPPYYGNPPELLVDANGHDHAIIQDSVVESRVLDFDLTAGTGPVVIREGPSADSELRTFQVARGPNGEMAVLMTFRDGSDGTSYDLFVSRFENGAWSTPQNVTDNANREEYKQSGTPDSPNGGRLTVTYKPNHAAGVFEPDGTLDLSLINMEVDSVDLNSVGSGVVGDPEVYFGRL